MKRNKYNNRHIKRGELTFDSEAEAKRYVRLKAYEDAGHISELEVHPRFQLLPAFTDRTGKRQRAIVYEADFSYLQDGVRVVEDVKGKETEAFKLKQKFFLAQYPDLDLRIIAAR
ncbi:MAG TPA: DUF1064 domain-containing protein [Phototrophicaceae bacterium]|nr:DUF1064 domain-containing protein [Phototrophicaceae bacterium]